MKKVIKAVLAAVVAAGLFTFAACSYDDGAAPAAVGSAPGTVTDAEKENSIPLNWPEYSDLNTTAKAYCGNSESIYKTIVKAHSSLSATEISSFFTKYSLTISTDYSMDYTTGENATINSVTLTGTGASKIIVAEASEED